MKVKNKKRIKIALILIILAAIFIGVYNMKLNNEINVVTQEVKIENLPKDFEGFTILQLTDLHSKTFGDKQEKITSLINKQKYDMIAITGDMQNRQEDGKKEAYEPLLQLLKGINNKAEVFYTPGNHGPFPFMGEEGFNSFYKINAGTSTLNSAVGTKKKTLTEVGTKLQDLGVKFLDKVHFIERNNTKLWITELLYKNQLDKITKGEIKNTDLIISVTHYPMNKAVYEGNDGKKMPPYDLILAGHYHGGQWRIPGIGAIIIPDLNQSGWFPSKERVSGFTEWGGFKQYVSRGLGAGGPIKLLRFRLFNKPEINIIKLVRR